MISYCLNFRLYDFRLIPPKMIFQNHSRHTQTTAQKMKFFIKDIFSKYD